MNIMNKQEKIRFLILRTVGNFFILLTLFGFLATFGPAVYFEAVYRISQARGVTYAIAEIEQGYTFQDLLDKRREQHEASKSVTDPSQGLINSVLDGSKTQMLSPKDTRFSVIIPKIGASEKVYENVDPSDQAEYTSVLKEGVAHAKGSSFPGYGGNTYIFAHSTNNFWNVARYNAVFYLLKELKPGDDVVIYFMDKRYNYVVTDTKIADADEVGYLAADTGQGEMLTLQTCWPPGTTWKRLLVFAKPKK